MNSNCISPFQLLIRGNGKKSMIFGREEIFINKIIIKNPIILADFFLFFSIDNLLIRIV